MKVVAGLVPVFGARRGIDGADKPGHDYATFPDTGIPAAVRADLFVIPAKAGIHSWALAFARATKGSIRRAVV
jgi:hypothetical protein